MARGKPGTVGCDHDGCVAYSSPIDWVVSNIRRQPSTLQPFHDFDLMNTPKAKKQRPMRADARRNRERLLEAAAAVFAKLRADTWTDSATRQPQTPAQRANERRSLIAQPARLAPSLRPSVEQAPSRWTRPSSTRTPASPP